MHFLRHSKAAWIVFFVAVLARLLYAGFALHAAGGSVPVASSGADCYFLISENILQGHGYSCDDSPPYTLNSIRPPMQPYFLVASYSITHSYAASLLLEILLGSLSCLFALLLAQHMGLSARASYVVGLLLALEPNSILFSTLFYSETLFTFFFLASLIFLFHYYKKQDILFIIVSACLLGLATLTKPTGEYLIGIYVCAVVLRNRPNLRTMFGHAAVLLLIFICTLLPWSYRNHQTFGVWSLSPQLGEQMYAILVPSVLSFENGTSFSDEYKAILAQGAKDPNQSSVADGGKFLSLAVPILLAHPTGLIIISANTALNFFIHDGMIEVLKHVDIHPTEKLGKPALFLLFTHPGKLLSAIGAVFFTPLVLILFGRIAWVLITALAFFGSIRMTRDVTQKNYAYVLGAIVLYFMVTTLVIGLAVTARYRVPVIALIFIGAVYGASEIYRIVRRTYLQEERI